MNRVFLGAILACLALSASSIPSYAATAIGLVASHTNLPPIRHGLANLKSALQRHGVDPREAASLQKATGNVVIVASLAGSTGEAAELLRAQGYATVAQPESFLVRRLHQKGRKILLLIGGDARGLMYALLDVADRVAWADPGGDPFREVRETREQPFVSERALSVYTMHRAYWESRFYDEAYWARYFDTLARNRFNSFVLIFGYENGGFLAPAYPYFFDVPEFPDVRMVGITADQQRRNLAALNRLIQMAHDRGLRLTIGLWDHIYRGGVQGGGIPGADEGTRKPLPGLVWGVTAENLTAYTKAALARLVQAVPELDGIQFRMHDESGLKNSEQEAFWRDVFAMMKANAPRLRLDLRAKGLPDSVISKAVEVGVPFRVTTKYWMEQMGLPFHPTHINRQNQFDRRHSYADLLRYPQRYSLHWRLWNGGTARVLLWGDPEYARRFADSTRLYEGEGFEVNEPLCTKMEAQPHETQPFALLHPAYRYYDYEFERYWHFFQVFGRLGYNPETPAEVWRREFEKRFGRDAAPHLEKGLHRASTVLPRIVAACYPYSAFPMTRGWAEKQRLGDLPAYARAEGSDIQQFASFDEEAQMLIAGGETAKVRPPLTSRWFLQTAAEVETQIAEADKRIGNYRGKEYDSTVTDLRILGNLARYHALRIPAAVSYRLFERTKDTKSLDEAITCERAAVAAWRQLVAAAGDVYSDDLMMGVRGANLCGHWKDELLALETGLNALERQRREFKMATEAKAAPRYQPARTTGDTTPPAVTHQPISTAPAGKPLRIEADVRDPSGVKWVRLRYRSVNQHEDYRTLAMVRPNPDSDQKDRYQTVIPAEHIAPAWDLMYLIEVMDLQGNGAIYPDLNRQTPYIVVRLQR